MNCNKDTYTNKVANPAISATNAGDTLTQLIEAINTLNEKTTNLENLVCGLETGCCIEFLTENEYPLVGDENTLYVRPDGGSAYFSGGTWHILTNPGGSTGGIEDVMEGDNISINKTTPSKPIVSAHYSWDEEDW